jgi:sterol desaturase/sphingolipid hydroxylase (fatty acid hydroxylase superfamily)
MEEYGVEPW